MIKADIQAEASHSNILDELSDLLQNMPPVDTENMLACKKTALISTRWPLDSNNRTSTSRLANLRLDSISSSAAVLNFQKKDVTDCPKGPTGIIQTTYGRPSPRQMLERLKTNLQAAIDRGCQPTTAPNSPHSAPLLMTVRSFGHFSPNLIACTNLKVSSSTGESTAKVDRFANLEVLRKMNIHILDKYVPSGDTPSKEASTRLLTIVEDSPVKKALRPPQSQESATASQTAASSQRHAGGGHKRSHLRISVGKTPEDISTVPSRRQISTVAQSISIEKMLGSNSKDLQKEVGLSQSVRGSTQREQTSEDIASDLQRLLQMKKKLRQITEKRKKPPSADIQTDACILIEDALPLPSPLRKPKPATIGSLPLQPAEMSVARKSSQDNLRFANERKKPESISHLAQSFWDKAAATKQKLALK